MSREGEELVRIYYAALDRKDDEINRLREALDVIHTVSGEPYKSGMLLAIRRRAEKALNRS